MLCGVFSARCCDRAEYDQVIKLHRAAREFELEHAELERARSQRALQESARSRPSSSRSGFGLGRCKKKKKKKKEYEPPPQYKLGYAAFSGNVEPRDACSSPLLPVRILPSPLFRLSGSAFHG